MWTPAELRSNALDLSGLVWRAVEHQYTNSSRKLVDSRDEHEALEAILEEGKPPYPAGTEHLDYLLKTPFRYHPKRPYGSRFGHPSPGQGVFYSSEEVRTALAEYAYCRIKFFSASNKTPTPRNQERLTVFSVNYQTKKGVDLTQQPFLTETATWTHPSDYSKTQDFADIAREAHIETIRYKSVRDKGDGINIALLHFQAFKSHKPETEQTWFLYLDENEINFERTNAKNDEYYVFPREQFIEL
jgi:hypothetical protein